MEFMGHIPGIAMRNHDQRLGEARSTLCKRVYRPSARDPGVARPCEQLKSFNVDPSAAPLVTCWPPTTCQWREETNPPTRLQSMGRAPVRLRSSNPKPPCRRRAVLRGLDAAQGRERD